MNETGWHLEARDGLVIAICDGIDRIEEFGHAFSTRRADGRADFDLGPAGPVDDAVVERRRRLAAAAGLGRLAPMVLRQVHEVSVVRSSDAVDGATGDIVLWIRGEGGDRAPAVRTADCVPILVADRRGRAAAAVHAGWRGTAAGAARIAVEALRTAGCPPSELVAALGPGIARSCYEVEASVLDRVAAASGPDNDLAEPSGRPGRFRLDLHAANRRQLLNAGLPPDSVHSAPWCTHCRTDLFYSYRGEGPAAGRQMAVVGPRP